MNVVDNAAALWIASSGALPTALPFDLVSLGDGWMIAVGLLLAAGALLSWATSARGAPAKPRALRIVHDRARRPRQPQARGSAC